MCDTQVILKGSKVYFAKNSDREASEAQYVVRCPSIIDDKTESLKTTYLSIPQVPDRYAVILSKPFWMWGAEMGINEKSVVIGNEAVFSKLVEKSGKGLLGMDLLRLGLERADSALAALTLITKLLEKYGQAGASGFRDKNFKYDNSYIIADPKEAWVLETAGRWWVAKRVRKFAAISNQFTIGNDYDLIADGLEDFALKNGYSNKSGKFHFAEAFNSHFLPFMAKSKMRRKTSMDCLKKLHLDSSVSLDKLAKNLRKHHFEQDMFSKHDNRDICMHAGGLTRPSQTCGSMIASVSQGYQPEIMLTATSAACLSLFKPIDFDFSSDYFWLSAEKQKTENSFWMYFEKVHRLALQDLPFRRQLIRSRDVLENKLFGNGNIGISMTDASNLAKQWHQQWQSKADESFPKYSSLISYDRFWKRLNRLDRLYA